MSIALESGLLAASKELLQEQRYQFPYHHLPSMDEAGVWEVARALPWGYEYLAVLDVVLQEVVLTGARDILDFGCGDGALLCALYRRRLHRLAGVDVSGRALSFVRGFLGENGAELFDDMSRVPGGAFDAVVAMEVLEHIPDSDLPGVFADIHSVLSEGGFFIASVPTVNRSLVPKHYCTEPFF